MNNKKLIEVALPLEAINKESAREKSIRHGHPSTLHLWWARRPLAAARAVIWSSLVDDPSSHPEQFPTEEEQNAERERLFRILEKLVVWENSNNPDVLEEAKAEIMKSTGGNPPALLDPFAGGGAIPLEAQRLGLEAHAHDLNPVAVMINKAMIEIPPKFAGQPPVHLGKSDLDDGRSWKGAAGLAEDVRYYGEWMKQEAFKRIGHLYPKVKDEKGKEHTVIAWIWARTVASPDPMAKGAHVPLVSSLMLSTKKGNKAWVDIVEDSGAKDGWRFEVKMGELPANVEVAKKNGTKAGKAKDFICCLTQSPIQRSYVQEAGKADKLSKRLMAVVAQGPNGRIYISPSQEQETLALSVEDTPDVREARETFLSGSTPTRAMITGGVCSAYGLRTWGHLFTGRQLTSLRVFSELVSEVQKQVILDGGTKEYGQAVEVYLAFVVDKLADICSSICTWINTLGAIRSTFARQAIPMTWDYAETNPFSNATGCFDNMLGWVVKCLPGFPSQGQTDVKQFDAQSNCGLQKIMVSMDPPYYDNISYAILSDFFYNWMRQSLKNVYFNEQDGELDKESRFCVELYTQCAFNDIKFGEADVLARAKNTSVDKLRSDGVLYSEKGMVHLLTREEIPMEVSKDKGIWLLTQQLTRAMETDGVMGAAKMVKEFFTSEPERAKALAYRLFTLAERRGWAGEAYAYNSLIVAWPDVQSKAAEFSAAWSNAEQQSLFYSGEVFSGEG